MSIRLSVCLLTWNEAANIERVLRSAQGVADELIVADTGSTDGTPRLARSLGATVVPHEWSEDFSAGRNAAIARARGDWVLWLNPDEELWPGSRDLLKEIIAPDSKIGEGGFGFLTRVQTLPTESRPEVFSESWDLRLFRRRPDARYAGRVHPSFPPALVESLEREGAGVSLSDVVIRQHAYLADVSPAKLRWGARLLEKELADHPGQLPPLVEYGQTLLKLKDPKGHEVMAEAAALLAEHRNAPVPPGPAAQRVLEYLLTTTPASLSQATITANQAEALALRWFATSPPLLWAVAARHFGAGRLGASVVLLERMLELAASGTYERSDPFDPRLLGPWPALNLGECYRLMGRPEMARRLLIPYLTDPEFQPRAAAILTQIDHPPATP